MSLIHFKYIKYIIINLLNFELIIVRCKLYNISSWRTNCVKVSNLR